ncbi:MAG: DNA polymerase III subunit delta', partial [Deltaproteobacteria bacterium]|nr:DNA polymerase III subunit delta' [Deltaproteobacteria bacterium]
VRILAAFLQKRSIPHALLFTGIEGVGKKDAALVFAMACNCTAEKPGRSDQFIDNSSSKKDLPAAVNPCGCCRSCRKIESGNHPDIIRIKPSGTFIKIDQIRGFCDTLAMKPYEARVRVVIISDAHSMNPSASNALLKMLEEPPDSSILILTALQISDLLPTIVSRCQHIRFNPVSVKSIETRLIENKGLAPDKAAIIAAMANGSISRAFTMNNSNWINRRNWIINTVSPDQSGQPGALFSMSSGMLMAFATMLKKNKDFLFDSLEIMKSWLRDLIIYNFHPAKIINKDLIEKIQYASQIIDINSLLFKIDAIQAAQKDIQSNANLRLTLETMMMRIGRGRETKPLTK